MIFKISGYNGKPDDPAIRLDMYTSTGLRDLPGWTCHATIEEPLNAGWTGYADWLRASHWQIADLSLDPSAPPSSAELPAARAADAGAFVRGGCFFAELPTVAPSCSTARGRRCSRIARSARIPMLPVAHCTTR